MILATISFVSLFASSMLILPLIIACLNLKEINKSPLKVIFIYCVVFSIYEVVGWIYALNGWQNHFISNTISYTDVIFWGYYYYMIIINKRAKNAIIALVSIALILITWSHSGIGKDFNRIDTFAHSITNISLITIVLMFFYQLLNNLAIENLFKYPHFWIAIAVLIYFSGIFFMDIFAEYIAFSKDINVTKYWDIKEYLTFIHRVFLALGFWFYKPAVLLKNSSN